MQNKKVVAGICAVAATMVLSVLRVLFAPALAENGGGVLAVVLVLVIPAIAAVLLVVSPSFSSAPIKSGRSLVSFGAVFTGVLSVLTAGWTFVRWNRLGEWPFPAPTNPTTVSTVFLVLFCVFSLLGGLFFVWQGFAWVSGKSFGTALSLLSLSPLVSVWVRICQYEMSYYSSLSVARHWGDLSALLMEMVFFLMLTRFVSKAEKQPRYLYGVSLCVGVLLTAACITRVVMALSGNQGALENSGLLVASDLGVALLAFGFAKAYTPAEQSQEEAVVAEKSSSVSGEQERVVSEEEKQVEALLTFFTADHSFEEEEEEDTESPFDAPLDLEDMILRIMENPEDEEY